MAINCCTWLDMARSGCKRLEMPGLAGNGWKLFKMSEKARIAGNSYDDEDNDDDDSDGIVL